VHPSPRAVEGVRALVRAALALEEGRTPSAAVAAGLEPGDLLAAASRHRVLELLHRHVADLGLEERCGPDLVAVLASVHAETRRRVAVQVLELARLLELFTAADLPVLAVKGPALAVQSAGDVAARGFGDLDLFVAPESVQPALELLGRHGWVPRRWGSAEPGTWAWRHLLGTFNEIAFDGPVSTVDLHWRLDPGAEVLPDFAGAWRHRVLVDVGPVQVPTLDPRAAFRHTCQHAARDDWRWLRSLVDVHRLARVPEVRELIADGLHDEGRHLRATVAVTRELVGLPRGAEPSASLRRTPRRGVVRAVRSQERPIVPERPVPMAQAVRDLRYRVVASRSPRALLGAVSSAAVPAPSVEGLTDRSGWTAVPKLVLRRTTWLLRQCGRWLAGRGRHDPEPVGRRAVLERQRS
jgi:hypothetical protein